MRKLIFSANGPFLLIDKRRTRRIPALDLATRNLADALNRLTAVTTVTREVESDALKKSTADLAGQLTERIEDAVGSLDPDGGIVYTDPEGGFTCGSEGKPPIPLPPEPDVLPTPEELKGSGVLDSTSVRLLSSAIEKEVNVLELFEDPREIAEKLDVELDEEGINTLRSLAPSRIDRITDPVQREVVQYLHRVLEDGRFTDSFLAKPASVSASLDIKLSDAAFDRILKGASTGLGGGQFAEPVSIAVGITVIVVVDSIVVGLVVTATKASFEGLRTVTDRSGLEKF